MHALLSNLINLEEKNNHSITYGGCEGGEEKEIYDDVSHKESSKGMAEVITVFLLLKKRNSL